jgi:hypothetical protein
MRNLSSLVMHFYISTSSTFILFFCYFSFPTLELLLRTNQHLIFNENKICLTSYMHICGCKWEFWVRNKSSRWEENKKKMRFSKKRERLMNYEIKHTKICIRTKKKCNLRSHFHTSSHLFIFIIIETEIECKQTHENTFKKKRCSMRWNCLWKSRSWDVKAIFYHRPIYK